jgi:hypothetical protein
MEVALILYMCSAIEKTCLDPYVWPETFYDKYGCMVQGYKESGKKIAEIGIVLNCLSVPRKGRTNKRCEKRL